MLLSVIIVNYNVKYFLEQCLHSVVKALLDIDAEIFVVDNASSDGSIEYLSSKFPAVRFCENRENVGFAKANNQALKAARGKYILFLNPDTIVPEDCFKKCFGFFETHPDAGALGIRMLDGTGNFLKESKRSFPSPSTSFFKLLGLSKLFPRSSIFSRYHLGHLDPKKNHEIDVMAGAFMMIRKEVLDKTGGFDEDFFMYGEDIDLSYRIQKTGYRNYYFSDSTILHFKGESTKKGTLNYVRMFYRAMSIFVRKHYGGAKAGLFNFFIELAIWLRALLSATGNAIRNFGLPLIDAGLILLSFWLAKITWNTLFKPEINYSARLLTLALPVFAGIFLVAAYYAGLYDRQNRRARIFRATVIATLVVLTVYSLLPETYRFSRAIMLLGTFFSFLLLSISRWLLSKFKIIERGEDDEKLQTVVVGAVDEYRHIVKMMHGAGMQERVLGRIAPEEDEKEKLVPLYDLPEFLKMVPVREIVFCEGSLSFQKIINAVEQIPSGIRIRLCAHGAESIVGSDSRTSSGKTVSSERAFQLALPFNRRMKRLLDVAISIVLLGSFPLHILLIRNPLQFLGNCLQVLWGRKTWVGYSSNGLHLPMLKKGVVGSSGQPVNGEPLSGESSYRIDYRYALDYSPETDLRIVLGAYQNLGGRSKRES